MQLKTITNTNNLTLDDIADIIDDHFESEVNLFFVCDKQLAEFIYDYIKSEYNVDDKNIDKEDITVDNIEEYYVSLYFSNDENNSVSFFVENAKGNSGEYKINDIEDQCVDYYICFDMVEDIVFDKLVGENATWSWVKVDMDECDGRNEVVCDKCDEGITYDELLDEFVERIQNTEGCPSCIREVLSEFADIFIPDEDDDINESTEECCDCDKCKEERFFHLLTDTLNNLQETNGCPECTMDILMNFVMEFQDIGIRISKN